MADPLPEPLDGAEYADAAGRVMLALSLGLSVPGLTAARLVATVEATRRVVDELRDAAGLTDLIRHDWETH